MLHQSAYPRDVEIINAAIPTGLTAVTSVDTEIYEINVSNPTAGAITFLVQDKQTSPQVEIPTISVPPNVVDLAVYTGVGLLSKGGVSWQAGSAGLVGSLRGRRLTGWTLAANGFLDTPLT